MFAASVHGKKYREHGFPCQDSCAILKFEGVQAIAVTDGHGGKDYFRSDIGSRLAVEIPTAAFRISTSNFANGGKRQSKNIGAIIPSATRNFVGKRSATNTRRVTNPMSNI